MPDDRFDIRNQYGRKIGELRRETDWGAAGAAAIVWVLLAGTVVATGVVISAIVALFKAYPRFMSAVVGAAALFGLGIWIGMSLSSGGTLTSTAQVAQSSNSGSTSSISSSYPPAVDVPRTAASTPAAVITQATVLTPSVTPTNAPIPRPAGPGLTGTVQTAGQIGNSIPGTLVIPPAVISSVVDSDTKPRDVFAVDLEAGSTLVVTLVSITKPCPACKGSFTMYAAPPGARVFEEQYASSVFLHDNACCTASLTAAANGTYYFAMRSEGRGQAYTMSFSLK